MGDKIDEELKKQREERERRMRPLREANKLAEEADKAAKAHDAKELGRLLDEIRRKKWDFLDTMPPVLGHPFSQWYDDLAGWNRGIDWLERMLDAKKIDWPEVERAVPGWLVGAKHRIEDALKN
ncbi:MAG: hypothetical protein ACXVZ4_08120 [Gaiellaceae bacterium]